MWFTRQPSAHERNNQHVAPAKQNQSAAGQTDSEDVTDGLENAPRELIGLLKGKNFGKKILWVSTDSTSHQ